MSVCFCFLGGCNVLPSGCLFRTSIKRLDGGLHLFARNQETMDMLKEELNRYISGEVPTADAADVAGSAGSIDTIGKKIDDADDNDSLSLPLPPQGSTRASGSQSPGSNSSGGSKSKSKPSKS